MVIEYIRHSMHRAAMLSLALLVSSSVDASTFRDPATGLAIDIAVPGAAVCFLRPESLRRDGGDCKGLNLGATGALEASVSLFAFVRFPDWWFSITGYPYPKLAGPMTRQAAREVIKGWVENGAGRSRTERPASFCAGAAEAFSGARKKTARFQLHPG
jgi:hypothetical protein